ncbi:MAG: hypothetical protein ACE15F_15045 [bacterium]
MNSAIPGSTKTTKVLVTNIGLSMATELNVSTSCSCTAVNTIPSSLPVGATFEMEVKVKVPSVEGPFTERVVLRYKSNHQVEPFQEEIIIKGNVEKMFNIFPRAVLVEIVDKQSLYESWFMVQNLRYKWEGIHSSEFLNKMEEAVAEAHEGVDDSIYMPERSPAFLWGRVRVDAGKLNQKVHGEYTYHLVAGSSSGENYEINIPLYIHEKSTTFIQLPQVVHFKYPKPYPIRFIISSTYPVQVSDAIIQSVSLSLPIKQESRMITDSKCETYVEIFPPDIESLPSSLRLAYLRMTFKNHPLKTIPVYFEQ